MCSAAPLAIVIEDDAEAADALSLLLADFGARAVVGLEGEDILDALGAHTKAVRWIIADYDLGPGPTGIVRADKLRRMLPQARVLVLTGAISDRPDRDARDAGYDIMRKPASPDAIVGWLEAGGGR